uniref:Uncharacterized protein n=1 Tax=Klebsiella phage vB_Kpn2-P1 TaxID=3230848 RepID=A0AAU8EEP7_9VIRU
MYIDRNQLFRFLELDLRWPLSVNPGRATGKTFEAINTAYEFAVFKGIQAVYVASGVREMARLEKKYNELQPHIKITTYSMLETYRTGRRFSCVMFDEPSLAIKHGVNGYVSRVARENQCPVIIFGE